LQKDAKDDFKGMDVDFDDEDLKSSAATQFDQKVNVEIYMYLTATKNSQLGPGDDQNRVSDLLKENPLHFWKGQVPCMWLGLGVRYIASSRIASSLYCATWEG